MPLMLQTLKREARRKEQKSVFSLIYALVEERKKREISTKATTEK